MKSKIKLNIWLVAGLLVLANCSSNNSTDLSLTSVPNPAAPGKKLLRAFTVDNADSEVPLLAAGYVPSKNCIQLVIQTSGAQILEFSALPPTLSDCKTTPVDDSYVQISLAVNGNQGFQNNVPVAAFTAEGSGSDVLYDLCTNAYVKACRPIVRNAILVTLGPAN